MLIKSYRTNCKDGLEITVKTLRAPLEEYKDAVLAQTSESMPWAADNRKRADGETAHECENYYFIAEAGNEAVSLMWYSEKNGVATYGLVFTNENYRGKGIINILLKECISFMAESQTLKAVYLAVSNDVAQAIYAKAGFEVYNGDENCRIMRKIIDGSIKDFDGYYFQKTEQTQINHVSRGDLPLLEALYNYHDGTRSKDFNAAIGERTAVECQIIDCINRREENKGTFMCIKNGNGNIVGACTLFDDEHGTKVLDFFVHENYQTKAKQLILNTIETDNLRNNKKIMTHMNEKDQKKNDLLVALGGQFL